MHCILSWRTGDIGNLNLQSPIDSHRLLMPSEETIFGRGSLLAVWYNKPQRPVPIILKIFKGLYIKAPSPAGITQTQRTVVSILRENHEQRSEQGSHQTGCTITVYLDSLCLLKAPQTSCTAVLINQRTDPQRAQNLSMEAEAAVKPRRHQQ